MQHRPGTLILYAAILVLVGFFIGSIATTLFSNKSTKDMHEAASQADHSHSTTLPHTHSHTEHAAFDASPLTDHPTIELEVIPDPKSGWNLHIITQHFVWSPEHASLHHVDNEGHAHLYIDGQKITRLYSDWFHIPELTSGTHVISVTLSTNDHADYIVDGHKIEDSKTITVP